MIQDARHDSRTKELEIIYKTNIGSYLGVPIYLSDDTLFGTICAVDPEPYHFSDEEIDSLMRYARILAIMVEKERQSLHVIEEKLLRLEKMSLVGKLAAGLGHELRNPLMSIRGLVQFLFEDEENNMYRDIILTEVDRMNELITDFILITQPTAPKVEQCSMSDLVKQTVQLMEQEALLYNTELMLTVDGDIPLVEVDPSQIKQVLMNIIKNAIEAIQDAGILGKIYMRVMTEGKEWVVIQVQDNGPGIPLSVMNKISEPFFSTKEEGTGLGLSISKTIIEEHKGTIQVENYFEGAIVTVRIPIRNHN